MNPYILTLADPRADLETVGGKGMSLARLSNAGLPVPGGFHVTTAAYRRFVTDNGLQDRILAALGAADVNVPATLEQAAQAIGRLFVEGQVPAEIHAAITAAYRPLADAPVAVRSSATAEDLPEASFAGQQETYLNIRGVTALLAAVQKCWASLWTARAIAYRIQHHIDQNAVALAVVVQELVFADAAGILFTANPVNGRRKEALINAAWGLGEAVVSGAVTPDTLTVDKATGKIVQRQIAEKLVMTVRTEAGTSEEPVPSERRKKPALSAAQAAELVGLGTKIEALYGAPMDIEWARAGGRFAIVQARPITALPPDWSLPIPQTMYARGSLAEHLPGPVTPLFSTLGLDLANRATYQLWLRIFGDGARTLFVGNGFYQPFNGYVYGGFYMGFRNMSKVLLASLWQIPHFFSGSVARWQAARARLAAVVSEWEKLPVASSTPAVLWQGAQEVFFAACCYFTDVQTTLPAASMSEILFTKFYDTLVRRRQEVEAAAFLLGFETGALRAEKSLYAMAGWARDDDALREYLLRTPAESLLADFEQAGPPAAISAAVWDEWRRRFRRHLDEFGRTSYEFDFANPTPAEKPGPLLEMLRAFLSGQAGNPYTRQQAAVARREQASRAVLGRLVWPLRGWFEKLLHWAQATGPMREDSIADMGMGHPLIRRMLAELGRRFVAGGAIQVVEDIYWLEQAEVETLIAALESGGPLPEFAGRIPARKANWQAALKFSPPVMLPEKSKFAGMIHGDEAEKKDGKIVLKGVGTSSGVVTAPACVLFGPEDFERMRPGDVLVAVTTTPAWTPLFTLASAVVTDIGGPLSHSSIVAREYGIPAVMAARSATRYIRSGQFVTVDGGRGTVTVTEQPG